MGTSSTRTAAGAEEDASSAKRGTMSIAGACVKGCRGTVSRPIEMARVPNARTAITWTGSPCAKGYPETVRRWT
jgi:hypothetical protein